jgi:hypothetical protein
MIIVNNQNFFLCAHQSYSSMLRLNKENTFKLSIYNCLQSFTQLQNLFPAVSVKVVLIRKVQVKNVDCLFSPP